MTTERTYRCNLCRDTIEEKNAVGIQFCSGHSIKAVPIAMAENHVCCRCLVQLQAIDVSKK